MEVGNTRIYGDIVVLLNFFVDFLLFLGTNRLSGFPPNPARAAAAAGVGSAYAAGCLVPGFGFLGGRLWRAVSLAGMAVVAFGANRTAVKRGCVFFLLSMALGGMAMSFGRGNFLHLVLATAGMWLICRVSVENGVAGRHYVPIQICHEDRQVRLTALVDSGNTLRDPITGEGVLVISAEAAQTLTGLTGEQLRMPLETLASHPMSGLRLIPYRAVGQAGGMLLAMRFSRVTLGTQRRSALVAFAPEGLGEGRMYQALTGGTV